MAGDVFGCVSFKEGTTMAAEESGRNTMGITQEISDLVKGLCVPNGDYLGCSFFLDRIETLSRTIDEIAEHGDDSEIKERTIIDTCYYIRRVVDEIRHVLSGQDRIVLELAKQVLGDDYNSGRDLFQPDPRKLAALRSLASLFQVDGLFYDDRADAGAVRAWSLAHGVDEGLIRSFLGGGTN